VSAQTIVIGVLAVLYVVSMVFMIRFLRRTRYYDLRLGLTGRPSAGKTVLSLLLYDLLMNSRSDLIRFTAESRSAIATYQAIRNIPAGEWPPLTSKGSVLQYDGTIHVTRRRQIELQIGDSAGEHWLGLTNPASSSSESEYLQWVLSAQAIVHVISAEIFLGADPEATLLEDVADLKLAARLMRSIQRGTDVLRPLLIVISKADLLYDGNNYDDELMVLHSLDSLSRSPMASVINRAAHDDIEPLLYRLGLDLRSDFRSVDYMLASVRSVTSPARLGFQRRDDVLRWIVDSAVQPGRRTSALTARVGRLSA
jgi:hypothetical protein